MRIRLELMRGGGVNIKAWEDRGKLRMQDLPEADIRTGKGGKDGFKECAGRGN